MGQILSQSEVDAILTGLDLGTGKSTSPTNVTASQPDEVVTPYDFEHPVPLRPSQLESLRFASAAICQSLQTGLSKSLHLSVVVNFIGVEQSTYRENLATAEQPACLAIFESTNSSGTWLLDISRTLAFTMIDCLLGGSPTIDHPPGTLTRPFTEVESRLIDKAVRAILPDLAGSLLNEDSLRMTRVVSDGSLLPESTSNEAVALISFEVICGPTQGLLQMCVPWKQVATEARPMNARELQALMRSGAVKVPVTAVANIARVKLSTRDLANLVPGDVLLTDVSTSTEVSLEVAGNMIFRGTPGQIRDRKVLRLTIPVNSDRSESTENGVS